MKIYLAVILSILASTICSHAFVLNDGTFDLNSEKVKQNIIVPAERGDSKAQVNLALIYKGYNNHDEAMKWLLKAAEQGNTTAMRMIAVTYAEGEGVQKDKAEALRWFRKAADKGDKMAIEVLKHVEK